MMTSLWGIQQWKHASMAVNTLCMAASEGKNMLHRRGGCEAISVRWAHGCLKML